MPGLERPAFSSLLDLGEGEGLARLGKRTYDCLELFDFFSWLETWWDGPEGAGVKEPLDYFGL